MTLLARCLRLCPALVALALLATPARASAPADAARSLVEAERAFARLAATTSTRDAFLAVLDDSGVLFRPTAVNGRRLYEPQPARPGVLGWEPEFAEAAAAGDLGYTTGPWSFRPTREDTAVAFGRYVSVWRREPPGDWRLLADLGISHARPADLAPVAELHPPGAAGAQAPAARALASLRAAERALRDRAALAAAATADVRVFHGDRPPAAGAAALERLRAEGRPARWRVDDLRVARSGDLGYTRGLRFAADTASFVRLWRRERGAWRVALDIENPVR